jgi:serine/threonine-protein kinase
VAVPGLVGQSEAAAKQQLIAKGLAFTVSRRAASGVNPGTVLATDPGAGAMVAVGSQVSLVVAAAPAPAPTTAAPTRRASPTPTPSATLTTSAATG